MTRVTIGSSCPVIAYGRRVYEDAQVCAAGETGAVSAALAASVNSTCSEVYADDLARAAYAAEQLIAHAKQVHRYANESVTTVYNAPPAIRDYVASSRPH